MPIYVILAAAAIVASIPLAWWGVAGSRERRVALAVRSDPGGPVPTDLRRAVLARSARERAVEPAVLAIARRARRITPGGMIEGLERKLGLSGERWPIESVLAAKLGLAFVAGFLGVLVWLAGPSPAAALLAVALAALAYFVPDVIISGRARRRQRAIQTKLPGALDQISVSVEAGLGFDAALARVGQAGSGPLAEELLRTLQDIRLGLRRRDAMERLLDRTDVDDLRRFVHAMRLADGYGIPIAQVLRVQSAELRDKRRQRAEEQAMKLPVKIIFPVIFCILPALFAVVIGPLIVRFAQGDLFPS